MKITFGTYELEFDDKLAQLFEKHMYETIQDVAWGYVYGATDIEKESEVCKQYSKEEVKSFILEGIKEELGLCGVKVNV